MKVMFWLILLFLEAGAEKTLFAQRGLSQKIGIGLIPADSLAFTQQWAYHWYILKDESGKFDCGESDSLKCKDTSHLFFTANCKTNVQGGYNVRYCYASIKKGIIKLNFSDGMPAYGNQYYVFISHDSFYCQPNVIYPTFTPFEQNRLYYKTAGQKLVVNQSKYVAGDTIKGYVSFTFEEILRRPNKKPVKTEYYFMGFLCTPLSENEISGW